MTMLRIGNKNIGTNVFLSPLAGCTDLAFRLIARENGARFCFYEMIDSNSITRMKRRSLDILKTVDQDNPIGAQILGSEPEVMLEAANRILSVSRVELMDINCACPVKKAIRKKSGAYLLTDRKLLSKIVKTISSSLDLPVTVKIRTGFDKADPAELANIVRDCENSGAQAIFVHGRTRSQGYSGEIDYPSIRLVKESISIPVIGVGNIMCALSAKRMFDRTGCDGIAVARGGLGNPWIFAEIDAFLRSGNLPKHPTVKDRKAMLIKHLGYVDLYNDTPKSAKLGLMRKVSLWYVKAFDMARRTRSLISGSRSKETLLSAIDSIA